MLKIRTKKSLYICIPEEAVAKSKEKYDAEVKNSKIYMQNKMRWKKKELFAAVEKSSKAYKEIMAFLQEEVSGDW